jgi:hypothetical protein
MESITADMEFAKKILFLFLSALVKLRLPALPTH